MPAVLVCQGIEVGSQLADAVAMVTCGMCPEWVWVNQAGLELVGVGHVVPVCLVCATVVVTDPAQKIGEVGDFV